MSVCQQEESSQQSDSDSEAPLSCPSTPQRQREDLESGNLLKTPEKQINTAARMPNFASQGSPLSKTEDSSMEAQGLSEPHAEARYQRFSSEMQTWFVGPIPSEEFVEELLPAARICDAEMPSAEGAFLAIRMNETNEKTIYRILCDVINKYGRCPGFILADTSDLTQKSGSGSMRPDLCLFGKGAPEKKITRKNGKYISHFGYMEMFFEIKINPNRSDPYRDSKSKGGAKVHDFLKDDTGRNGISKNVGQSIAYASEISARQHRTHVFSVSIYGATARLYRWDRAGVIISDLIDLHKNPEILCRFLWRYSQATDPQRGFDTSITVATDQEELIFKKYITERVKEQLSPDDSQVEYYVSEHYEPQAVFKIPINPRMPNIRERDNDQPPSTRDREELKPWEEIWQREVEISKETSPEPATNNIPLPSASETMGKQAQSQPFSSRAQRYKVVQYFLVSVPLSTPLTNTGYGTREYWAVKLPDTSLGETEYSVVFLKDTWRIVTQGMEVEGDIIVGDLLKNGVKFVSDIVCQGDVIYESRRENVENSGLSCGNSPANNIYQCTLTGDYVDNSWNRNKKYNFVMKRVHYRLASVEVGYPLDTFRGTKELIHGGRCAYLAARASNDLCGRNHRNISLKNILLVKKHGRVRVGFLINWDMSKKENVNDPIRMYARSATWAFLSIGNLEGWSTNSIKDDMESFYYVVLYASILWLPNSLQHIDNLEELVEKFFNSETIDSQGRLSGGETKVYNLSSGKFYEKWGFSNEALRDWLEGVLKLQQPYVKDRFSPSWIPEALDAIWKEIDERDLPMDDKVVNRALQQKKRAKKKRPVGAKAKIDATRPSVRSASNKGESSRPQATVQLVGPSHPYGTRSKSSKRIISFGIGGRSQSFKRQKKSNDEEENEDEEYVYSDVGSISDDGSEYQE